jgi:hypothetical protein
MSAGIDSCLAQTFFGLDRGQRLVHELARQTGLVMQLAGKAADALGGSPPMAVEANGFADDEPLDSFPACDVGDALDGLTVAPTAQRLEGCGHSAIRVRNREPDPLFSKVDAKSAHSEEQA